MDWSPSTVKNHDDTLIMPSTAEPQATVALLDNGKEVGYTMAG